MAGKHVPKTKDDLDVHQLKAGAFHLRTRDGTNAIVMGGQVVHVFQDGERPHGWEMRACRAKTSPGIKADSFIGGWMPSTPTGGGLVTNTGGR